MLNGSRARTKMDDIPCIIFTSDNSEWRVVSNRCGGLSLVFEERAYELKHTRKQKKYCVVVPKLKYGTGV
ncbi:hypothetical protein T06_16759 [Trichinella sp. T6]|nr:hypothetical protein T06_16759 [Trichinella sp. T6]